MQMRYNIHHWWPPIRNDYQQGEPPNRTVHFVTWTWTYDNALLRPHTQNDQQGETLDIRYQLKDTNSKNKKPVTFVKVTCYWRCSCDNILNNIWSVCFLSTAVTIAFEPTCVLKKRHRSKKVHLSILRLSEQLLYPC